MPATPRRVLPLHGATNFRDLGGYPGADSRTVRWQRLFRSDHLSSLSAADHAALAALGLTRVFDFRGASERSAAAYEIPGVEQRALTIEPTVVQRVHDLLTSGQRIDTLTMTGLMQELYRNLVVEQSHRYAEFFELLLDTEGAVAFHCTAGKDRTGVAAALLLLSLGVPRAEVMHDYLLSNDVYRRPPPPEDSPVPPAALAVLWGVQASFLEAALQTIEERHGNVEQYLRERLGLSAAARARLHERYLELA